MKKVVCIVLSALTSLYSFAQDSGANGDIGRLALTPVVLNESGIPSNAHKLLNSKLTQIVTKCGLAADSANPRFVVTADIDLLGKEITATAPSMTVVELATTIYVGDAESGQLFGSYAFEPSKGLGANETKAYMEALKKINVNDPGVKNLIESSKAKIVEYYNSQIDFIVAEAQALADSQKFEEAMLKLSAVPTVCKDAHAKAMAMISKVFQSKIDLEGMKLYNEAVSLWKVAKSAENGLAIVELLAQINPLSSAASQGRTLVKEVESYHNALEARRREIEERNWAHKMQQYSDQQAAESEQRQFDYEVFMSEASSGSAAAHMALEEVKGVVSQFTSSSSFGNANNAGGAANALIAKVSSWFN